MVSEYQPFADSTTVSVKDTPASGRAVFANHGLAHQTTLLTTTPEQSPLAHVILRPYRKEACAQCFSYDRGREWKIRNASHGTAFCSDECHREWEANYDALMLEASIVVESFCKSLLKKQRVSEDDGSPDGSTPSKSEVDTMQYIQAVWEYAEAQASELRQARTTSTLTRAHRAVLTKTKSLKPDPDILSYILSGILAAYRAQKSMGGLHQVSSQTLLPSLFALAEHTDVFVHTPTSSSPLLDYTASYLVLLAILPPPFLHLVTTDLIVNLASRASHNAFSIRPEGDTDGEQSGEFLGWGVWPEASFFNHSCRPNVRKERLGRCWSFMVDAHGSSEVEAEEQLCITYLGGDEQDIDVNERRQRLLTQWGFWCSCNRCLTESRYDHEEQIR